jgi:hypothetical protein
LRDRVVALVEGGESCREAARLLDLAASTRHATACASWQAPDDASMMRWRTVAIEFGMWRSGRNGGSSGSKLREPRGGTRS